MKKLLILFLIVGFCGDAYGGMLLGSEVESGSDDLLAWACEDLTAEIFDATDGGTIVPVSNGTPSYSFETGVTNDAIQLNSETWAYVPATDGNNINLNAGTVEFDIELISGTSSVAHRPWAYSSTDGQFDLRRSSVGETRYGLDIAGASYFTTTAENIYDGSPHHVVIIWDCAAQTASLTIDTSTYDFSLGSTNVPNAGSGRMYFNGFSLESSSLSVQYDNVQVR